MNRLTVQLRPTGPGSTLAARLRDAIGATAGNTTLRLVAIVVELEPVADGRPDAIKLRLALKQLRRRANLAAEWSPRPPERPKVNARPKRAKRKGAA